MTSYTQNLWGWTKSQPARKFFSLCRWIHIYLSTVLFSLLFLFSLTGVTLNHPDWFSEENTEREYSINLPEDIQLEINKNEPSIDTLKNYILDKTNLQNPRSIDINEGEISFDYPLPAGYAFVMLLTDTMTMEIEYKQASFINLLNDLHKGRHTDKVWSLLIDISAIGIILMSLTGIVILLQHSKKRFTGLVIVILGTMLPILIFIGWVPNFNLK